MATELTVQARYHGGMRMIAQAGHHSVNMDYPLPPYTAETVGQTPLQLLLSSLAGCSGSTLALLLNNMKQPFDKLTVNVKGSRQEEHPTMITEISMEFVIEGDNIDETIIKQALKISEEQICPVWNMLKKSTPITATYRLKPSEK